MPANDKLLIDASLDFFQGMNSGIIPRLVPQNQASFLQNVTVRGGYPTDRPGFQIKELSFASEDIESAASFALFQGATFYQPDAGTPSLRAAIGGRLFQFTPSLATSEFLVTELTIPGDPNPATITQAWLWQSEKWTIWNDGLSVPVFTDETTSRRSLGADTVLAITSASFIIPAVGDTVTVPLTAAYTGDLNVQTLIQGLGLYFFQIVAPVADNNIKLTCIYDDPLNTHPVGQQVVVIPQNIGFLLTARASLFSSGKIDDGDLQLQFEIGYLYPGAVNDRVLIFNTASSAYNEWRIIRIDPTEIRVENESDLNPPGFNYPVGSLVTKKTGSTPNTVLGTLLDTFAPVSNGDIVLTRMSQIFTGTPNTIVYLGTSIFKIEAIPPILGATVTLLNIDGVPAEVINSPANLMAVPELPPGRMGAYGLGRNWIAGVDAKSYMGFDIVGGGSGSATFNYRDAVFKNTENIYLAGGGGFVVPGSVGDIRALIFAATLDSTLGQGPLQIHTPNIVFTCNAPIDRTEWEVITNPIQTQLVISNGGLGQNSTQLMNSDVTYRAVDGIRTIKLTRAEFEQWGRTPISNEMVRVLKLDQASLLQYGSAIVFDNRLLETCSPVAGTKGVFHQGLIALNLSPISTLGQKSFPVYDGLWTGINVLQLVKGIFSGVERCFAFTYNQVLDKLELYEILKSGEANFDNGDIPITKIIETGEKFLSVPGKGMFDLVCLKGGEIYVDDVVGRVNFQVYYKNDQFACWVPWHSWTICAKNTAFDIAQLADANLKPQFRTDMGLPEPDANNCDPDTTKPYRIANSFQFKFVITGHCRLLSAKYVSTNEPKSTWSEPICDPICDE